MATAHHALVSILQSSIKSPFATQHDAAQPLFQFYKVRLKECCTFFEWRLCLFQFYKVRLKAGIWYASNVSPLFQFYKVRLKESGRKWTKWPQKVSILQSSIKSPRLRRVFGGRHQFQFYKVRLKDYPVLRGCSRFYVSILQSSIKRLSVRKTRQEIIEFQFYKVRLKAHSGAVSRFCF